MCDWWSNQRPKEVEVVNDFKEDYGKPGFHCVGCGKYKPPEEFGKNPLLPGLCVECDKLISEGSEE